MAFATTRRGLAAALALAALALGAGAAPARARQDWTHVVRIAGHPLRSDNAAEIVHSAMESGVFGIEVDNDVTGRYESFLDPTAKLHAIAAVADRAHQAGNRAFVYIAGWECITAHADRTAHTLAKDHPDWVQRKITGEPAVFTGGAAFWIEQGDEDVWVSPYAAEWRARYMERVRQIAATGIDGIYVDVPYWMTHFDGWEDTWASFDDHTVEAFRTRTGLDARRDVRLGDFGDEGFRRWVAFRIRTVTDFMREVRDNARAVNPACVTIAEIYPGIEQEVVRVGADIYELYGVVDAIAHEYEYGSGDHMASSRTPLDWFRYLAGMYAFRAFAGDRATWMLNYSWDGDRAVDPKEAMMNLFATELAAGVNAWDASGHVMSGSNDITTRTRVFRWIASHEATFYRPRRPIDPVGVYFSPATRDAGPDEFVRSFQGILVLLLRRHVEFQIVTPRTLREFQGRALVLPDVRVLDAAERSALDQVVASGRTLVVTGRDATGIEPSPRVIRLNPCPGKVYTAAIERDVDAHVPEAAAALLSAVDARAAVSVDASERVATQIASVDGRPHVFFANFGGLVARENAVQTTETGASVAVSARRGRAYFLPFLGRVRELRGRRVGGRLVFALPPIEKAATFWFDPAALRERVGHS
jgi:hypothetical protein